MRNCGHFFILFCVAIINAGLAELDSVLQRELPVCLLQSNKLKTNVNRQKDTSHMRGICLFFGFLSFFFKKVE